MKEKESEISRLKTEIENKENVRILQLEPGPSKPAGKYIIPQKKKKDPLAEAATPLATSGAGEPNAEYEMLLSEKDAIIAEYLSGKFIH